jgi:hypothetical protein
MSRRLRLNVGMTTENFVADPAGTKSVFPFSAWIPDLEKSVLVDGEF